MRSWTRPPACQSSSASSFRSRRSSSRSSCCTTTRAGCAGSAPRTAPKASPSRTRSRWRCFTPSSPSASRPTSSARMPATSRALMEEVTVYESNYKATGLAIFVPMATLEFAILDMFGKMANRLHRPADLRQDLQPEASTSTRPMASATSRRKRRSNTSSATSPSPRPRPSSSNSAAACRTLRLLWAAARS